MKCIKSLIAVIFTLFLLGQVGNTKDSTTVPANSINNTPDLEMYGQNIKEVNRVETNRVIFSGTPQSDSDGVPKSYIDQRVNHIETEIAGLKVNINSVLNKLTYQISSLSDNINSISNQLSSIDSQLSSLENRVSRVENRPPPSCAPCPAPSNPTPTPSPTPKCPREPRPINCGSHGVLKSEKNAKGCIIRYWCHRPSGGK